MSFNGDILLPNGSSLLCASNNGTITIGKPGQNISLLGAVSNVTASSLVSQEADFFRLNVGGNANLSGDVNVAGNANLVGELNVASAANFLNLNTRALTVDGAAQVKSTLVVDSAVSTLSSLNVSGNTILRNNLNVSGPAVMSNTMVVNGNSTLNSNLAVANTVSIGSSLDVTGAANMRSTLNVANAATLASTLNVSGAANLNNSLNVANAATLGSTLNVSGAVNLNNTLNASNAATMGSTLNVSGAVNLNNSLNVANAATMNSNLNVVGNFSVSGSTSIPTLNVATAATVGTTLNVSGAANLNNSLNVGAAATMGSTLNVSGAVNLNNSLNVANAATMNSTLNVSGAANLNNSLNVANAATMNSSLNVSGAARLNNSLNVANAATMSSSLNVVGDFTVNGFTSVPTPVVNDNSLKIATTSFVNTAIANLINSSPTTLDTLQEIASAINNDPNFYSDFSNLVNLKAPISNPTFLGTATVPSLVVTNSAVGITSTMVGLGNVANTAPADLPVSNATQTALNLLAPLAGASFTGNVSFATTVSGITKDMVGLSNVANTAPADLPVSNATQTALNLLAPLAGASFTGNVSFATTVSGITKDMVGLGNVANTAPADLPVSNATQTALNLLAPLSGASFTGTVSFATTVSGITQDMVGLGNVANTAPADLPISTATQSGLSQLARLDGASFTGLVNFGTSVTGLTQDMVGLGNVANTAPADLPISTATQSGLSQLARLDGAAFTGNVSMITSLSVIGQLFTYNDVLLNTGPSNLLGFYGTGGVTQQSVISYPGTVNPAELSLSLDSLISALSVLGLVNIQPGPA